MDCQRTATYEEMKAYFRNLWRPMAPECALKNLKRILIFLQSSAEEVCVVNMQEKYLPFYYMIVLDDQFLQTTFITDECKIATHEILRTLEANRNAFTWEVSFSRQIAGIPVVFKKVYTQPSQNPPRECLEIPCAFKETWIKTTLEFIKSSRLVLKYPNMPRRGAMYIYKGILKLNDEELGLDSLWRPVWEAMNILKLRYEYIVSIHRTSFNYSQFVQFEKVVLKRKSCAIEDKNPITQWNSNVPKLLVAGDTHYIKNKVTSNYRIANDVLLPVVNHKELIKALLEKSVTKCVTIIYALKVNGYNMVTKPLNDKFDDVIKPFYKDIPPLLEYKAVELATTEPNDEIVDMSLSTLVQDECNMKSIQQIKNVVINVNCQDTTVSNKIDIILDHKSKENKDRDTVASENIVEQPMNLLGNAVNENAIKDVNANDAAVVISPAENEINCSNKESQLIKPNAVIDEIELTHKTDSVNENPSFQQITKPNYPLYLKEEDFGIIDDENETDSVTNDVITIKEIQTTNSNNDISQCSIKNKNKNKNKKNKNKIKPPLSEKAQRRREAKIKSRHDNKILRYQRLINTVPPCFVLKSFKAILDFVNDDSRASMDMVSLNIHEFNVLRKLYKFSPDVVPVERVFHVTCWGLVRNLFDCLKERKVLDIAWVIPHEAESNTSSVKYTKPFKKSRNIKQPASVLEKMNFTPVRLKSPGRLRESPGHRRSQSQTVSPLRHKLIPTGQRPPAVNPTENLTQAMKAKMIEQLAVPLESDKALRMMRLMGWKGGALGVREGGLIEPIKPQLDLAKGVGLGYERGKSTNLCINNFQTKDMDKKCVSEEKIQKITIDKKNAGNISENNKSGISIDNKNNIVAELKVFDKPNLKYDTNIDYNKKFPINVNNYIVETQCNSSEVVSKSNENTGAWTIGSFIKNNTPINTCDDSIGKSMQETDSTGKMKGTNGLRNESLSNNITDRSIVSTNIKGDVKDKSLVHKNIRTVKTIGEEEIFRTLQIKNYINKVEPFSLQLLDPPAVNALYLSNRIQFLIHLLALLQSNKTFTVVSYVRKPIQECVEFIGSVIWSLNRRVGPTPFPLPSESRIVDACIREMQAHAHIILSYQCKNRLVYVEKSDNCPNNNPDLADVPRMAEYCFEITHSVKDFYCHMPQGYEEIIRSKIVTNRIILEFVKSNDRERVYDYGRSSNVIRWYIISIISLLNRQISEYHLELENSEHCIFRETLNNMKNLRLIFRFDTQQMHFTILQLVKVDLTKGCHNCYIANNLNRTATPHIDGIGIDNIPNNLGYSKDAAISKSDKDVTVDKINNEKICDQTAYATDGNKVKASGEYLTREHGIDSKVNEETNTKNESENETDLSAGRKFTKCVEKDSPIQNDASKNEGNSTEYIINNDEKEYLVGEEMSLNFHDWPKRIKKSDSRNTNLNNDNIQWNSAENYEGNFRVNLKRKIIKLERKTVKKTTERVNIFIENNVNSDTIVENSKDLNMKINKEERCSNIVEDCSEPKTNVDVVTSEISIKDEENTVDKTLDIVDPISEEKQNINYLDTLNVKAADVISWPKKILVQHYKYPEYAIDTISVMSLQSLLYDAIITDQYLPRLKCNGLKRGGIIYTCYDYASYVWLFKHLQWYTLLDYEETSDQEQNSYLIEMKVNTSIKVDTKVMFKNIEKLYGDIKTCSWNVLQIKYFTYYCVISVEIDDSSMNSIKMEDYSLFVGIDKAEISVVHDKIK